MPSLTDEELAQHLSDSFKLTSEAAKKTMDRDYYNMYITCCTHNDAFEVYLPLVRIFGLQLLKYKEFICPSCKTVGAKPWEGYTFSAGDGVEINTK